MPASSQASSELSTASFTAVSSALRGLSNPNRCRFFAKNSLTEISRCFAAMASAVTRFRLGPWLSFLLMSIQFLIDDTQIWSHRYGIPRRGVPLHPTRQISVHSELYSL